jgi:signal transduction histidine kinase
MIGLGLARAGAQYPPQRDSLEVAIKNYKKEDVQKLDMLYKLFKSYNYSKIERTAQLADSILALAKKLNTPDAMANAYLAMGLNFLHYNQNDAALANLNLALPYLKHLQNKALAIDIYKNIGTCYSRKYDFPEALHYMQLALDEVEKNGSEAQKGDVYYLISGMYFRDGDIGKSILYGQKSLESSTKANSKATMGLATEAIAQGLVKKNPQEAIKLYVRALQIGKEIQDRYIATIAFSKLIELYFYVKDYNNAFFYIEEKRKLEKDAIPNGFYEYYLATYYMDAPDSVIQIHAPAIINRMVAAETNFTKATAIAQKNNNLSLRILAMTGLTQLYEKQQDFTNAYATFRKLTTLNDSLFNDNSRTNLARREIEYSYAKKEDSLKLQQALTNSKLNEQMLLTKQEQQKLLLNQQALSLANKDKDLQHLAFLKTQADLQNQQLAGSEKEKQLKLLENEKQLQRAQLKNLEQEKLAEQGKKTQVFIILAGCLAIALITIYLLQKAAGQKQLRLTAELAREKAEQQLKEAAFTNKMNDVTLSALRSQINPHFLFNCLNSIKLFTMENNNAAASEYLGKFSKLIRSMLDASRADMTTLAAELESLKLYIELEAMRFKDKLRYEIKVDKNVDADFVEIPPLLIQPYIENAIWNGLMHKEEGGYVHLHVAQPTAEMLRITITDNGVGRARAAELKSKSAMPHKSHGTRVTGERIALIKEKYGVEASVVITDLFDQQNQPAGTQVIITLPLV